MKGKDIKTKGDCLVHCYTKRIEVIAQGSRCHTNRFQVSCWPYKVHICPFEKPEGFEGW